MNRGKNPRVLLFTSSRGSWLQRIVVFLLAVTVAVLAFFFLTVALAAGVLLAAVIAVRWWWLTRKLRSMPRQETFEGEYVVIEHAREKRSGTPHRFKSENSIKTIN